MHQNIQFQTEVFFGRCFGKKAQSKWTRSKIYYTCLTLKLLKIYLRSTMSENRLNGLAMIYIHSMINIDIDQVIDQFLKRKNRNLDFLT
jgi:hypothetical protein